MAITGTNATMSASTPFSDQAMQLLDFSSKLDIALLDSVVTCLYGTVGPEVSVSVSGVWGRCRKVWSLSAAATCRWSDTPPVQGAPRGLDKGGHNSGVLL